MSEPHVHRGSTLTTRAYVLGDPVSTPFAAKIAVEAGVRVLGVQYSLCRDEATAFPAPLLDALAAFRYLTESLSFEPGNIVVLGESAGGHLTLSLATQLAASGRPLPGALALCSPWVDMTMGFNSWKTNTDDYLPTAWLAKSSHSAARHYAPEAVEGAFFSPALATPRSGHWAFLKDVPVFITLGTAEVFADEIDVLTKTMQDDGVDAKLWKVSSVWL